jgi:hypothetical protein
MHRRRFLKLISLAAAGILVNLPFPMGAEAASTTASYRGSLYRAGTKGKILVSSNGGASWQVHMKLGRKCSVSKLAVDRSNHLRATIGYAGYSFGLVLAPDNKRWLTT